MDFLKKISFDTQYAMPNYRTIKKPGYSYYREILFFKGEQQEGYIIGSCFKFEGYYHEGRRPYSWEDEGDSPSFTNVKRIDMWEVVTGFNKYCLVPKKPVDESRIIKNESDLTILDSNEDESEEYEDEFLRDF